MTTGRPSKAECLAGYQASIGAVERLGPETFAGRDRVDVPTRPRRDDADHCVSTEPELRDALATHDPGDVVWIDGEISLDGAEGIRLSSVTLASGYNLPGHEDGRLVSTTKPYPLLRAGDETRVTGLQIHGDEFEYFDPGDRFPGVEKPIYEVGASCGVVVDGDDVRLDCLELSGWTFAGVSVRREGRTDTRTHVHHVDVVDNPADSLGYGVSVREGAPLVEHGYFDNNRHSVAGSGWDACGYVLRFNVVGGHHSSHAIDMHGDDHDGDGPPIAGRRLTVRDNVVKQTESFVDGRPTPAVKVRGRPIERSEVVGNWLFNDRETVDNRTNRSAIRQLHAPDDGYRNLRVAENVYGTELR